MFVDFLNNMHAKNERQLVNKDIRILGVIMEVIMMMMMTESCKGELSIDVLILISIRHIMN